MNATSLLPLLAELLVKSAAILLAAALVDRAWRRVSAAQRHGVWLATFVALLLLPATRLVAPHWNLARVQPVEVRVRITNDPASPTANTSEPEIAPAAALSAPTPPPWGLWSSRLSRVDWFALAINFWLAGAVAMLGRRALGSLRLRAMRRASIAAAEDPLAEARRIASEFGITRSIALRMSPSCRVPLTWGTLRPVLMLPEDAADWPTDRLRAALRHELAHIRRGDYAMRLLADLVRAFYWPNPLVWFASRALRSAQEQACDDLVLNAGTCPTEYATQLCEVARRCIVPHGAVAMAQPSTLESRIRAIVDATRDRRPLTIRAAVLSSAFVALALAASTAAQLRAAEPAPAVTEVATPAAIPPTAAPVESAAQGKVPRIRLQARFIEIAPDADFGKLYSSLFDVPFHPPQTTLNSPDGAFNIPAKPKSLDILGVLTEPKFQALAAKFGTTNGLKILSAPSVIALSKQKAEIEIGNELRYATAWKKGAKPDAWKPITFATKFCGSTLETLPEIGPDGYTMDLDLRAETVELLGFIDPDTRKPAPAGKEEPEIEGPRRQAVFSTRKGSALVSIFFDQTVVMELSRAEGAKPFAAQPPKGRVLVFLTASVVQPNGEKAAVSAPAPVDPVQAEIEAKFVQLTTDAHAPIVIPHAPEPAPLTSARKSEPQLIEIEARFVQVTPGQANGEAPLKKPMPLVPESDLPHLGKNAIDRRLFDENARFEGGGSVFQSFLADARKKKSAIDVFSMPKVTTKSGQRAVIEIIRERRYATEWKKGTTRGTWKGTAFETRNTGVTLEAEPTLQADGTIAVDLVPHVVDFLGFENLDTGKPMAPGTDDSAPEGPRLRAVFSGLMLRTKAVVKPGETIKLGPLPQSEDVKPFANRVRPGETVVFVTASIFLPNGEKVPVPARN